MPALAVPAFVLAWWLACYLIGRDPRRSLLRRAGLALFAYACGVAAWTVQPGGDLAQILLCVPALVWAGVAVGLLPDELPERRQIDLGWMVLSVAFLITVVGLPAPGRVVALAPLAGGLVLLWRFRDTVRPAVLPPAVTVAAVLYGVSLVILLVPVALGLPGLVLAAMGLDMAILGYLVAAADAMDAGERLLPDLRRAAIRAVTGALVVAGPATLTMLAAPGSELVLTLQFVVVAGVMTFAGLSGPLRRGMDRVSFPHDDRLRLDRRALLLLGEALPRRQERLIAMSEADFCRLTERALADFGDLGRLLRSPLLHLPQVDRRMPQESAGKPLARAMHLRAVLTDGVDRLKPRGAFGTAEQWRHYNAVHFCWVRGLRPYARRRRLDGLDRESRLAIDWFRQYVPKRTMRHWQREGAALVAGHLWEDLRRVNGARPGAAAPTRSG